VRGLRVLVGAVNCRLCCGSVIDVLEGIFSIINVPCQISSMRARMENTKCEFEESFDEPGVLVPLVDDICLLDIIKDLFFPLDLSHRLQTPIQCKSSKGIKNFHYPFFILPSLSIILLNSSKEIREIS
jgi:hypothetical protein